MLDHRRPAALVLLLLTGVLTAACGEADAGNNAGKQVGEVATVACPDRASRVDLPSDFTVPLPAHSVVVDVRNESDSRTIVTSVVPDSEKNVLHALQREFAAHGLTLTDGETEEHDAESNFTGGGLTGRWGIRELTNCSGPATRIDVVVRPKS